MNPDRQQALEYLRAPADGLWRWTENGAVIVWHDGTTIAFREEIIQVIEWLAPNGLPAFGALVFLLAACRGKVPQVSDIMAESPPLLTAMMGKDSEVLLAARKQMRMQLEAALEQLHKVSKLPAEVNAGIKARCGLAEAVFETAKKERWVQAATILSGLTAPMTDSELQGVNVPETYIRQIHVVAEGLKPHTAESLILRMRTGLDALPAAIDMNLPPTEQARLLIDELSRDKELGCIARAARELMAALRLPRRLGDVEELSLGGVADITNRGPLDRLLLSELAHDDLTLSVRVALNEALYLRREPPVREPPGALMLLLDSGVRLWGVPRVLATAVALALIARDKQHSKIGTWRAHKTELPAVDLLSRNGLTQHLAALETEAHPGGALSAFAGMTTAEARNQSVLITHRDTLMDPEFRRAIAEHPEAVGFIAVVDREGRFEVHALPLAHRPPLCEADINLAAIFGEKTGVPPIKMEVDPEAPAIFGVRPFPFLLPVAGKVDYWIPAEHGYHFAVLNDRRLVQFRDHQTGGCTLANDLPNGKTLWLGCVDGTVHIVKGGASQRPARLLSLPLPYGELRVTDLVAGEEVKVVHGQGDVILLMRDPDVRAYSLEDGRLLHRILNPHRWVNGRYFQGRDHFYFVFWDGTGLRFAPVILPKAFSPSVICQVFDRTGMEGPWLVQKGGLILCTADGKKLKLPMPPQRQFGLDEVRISRDGHRVYAAIQSAEWGRFMDLKSGLIRDIPPAHGKKLNIEPPIPLPTCNLFHVVEAIGRIPEGIALRGRKNRWRKLILNTHTRRLQICEVNPDENLSMGSAWLQPVLITGKKTVRGQELQLAEWACGSKAFLDWRGLLHLKSHDAAVPEISLVLADGEAAGWTSDGHVCGPPFFFEGGYTSEPAAVMERIQNFLSRL